MIARGLLIVEIAVVIIGPNGACAAIRRHASCDGNRRAPMIVRPEVTGRAVGDNLEPLAVSPRQACLLLGVGNTYLYELLRKHELESYWEGRARKITMQSIRARYARPLAAAARNDTKPQPRRRGRPRKQTAIEART